MSLSGEIKKNIFAGYAPFSRVDVQVDSTTHPNGVVTALKGTILIMDYDGHAIDGDVFMNTDGATAWVGLHDASA